ncbi:GNAT family N-acetyltransferase [Pantanalinema sp. GBBB05]|uniref:GNAT family N-acetyltransferase n=1 Tax=Pantanalinema sp. GBBB05 TaxID=2604139 RepID=UPI001DC39FFA|nr:GNAT family N-acetyltransferase [Pantanalinema sp. GBBB05]
MNDQLLVPPGYTIRTMTRKEIDLAIEWAASEGWNPGLYDADSFFSADPHGFLIGEMNHQPIATISAVKYGDTFGFIGFYIVKSEYRGQGYGFQLWNAALNYLAGRNIGLDGVVAQQSNYQKSGFKLAYRNIRYEGVSGGSDPNHSAIIELSQVPFEHVECYDRAFFPEHRSGFLRSWFNQPESIALGILEQGKLAGYGMIRVCRSGYKIGPLFADRPELAEILFLALKSRIKSGKPIYLDVPEPNQTAVALATTYQMRLVFETARMYTGEFPDLPLHRLFGVTTFELG